MRVKMVGLFAVVVGAVVLTGCSKHSGYLENYRKGRELYEARRLEEAISFFDRAISEKRSFKQAYLLKSKCYYYLHREKRALQSLERVLRIHPEYVDAHYWAGKILYLSGNFAGAREHLLEAVRESSSHLEARYLLGEISMKNRAFDRALLNYTLVEGNLDIIALAKLRKGEIYAASGQYGKALQEIEFVKNNKALVEGELVQLANDILSHIELRKAHSGNTVEEEEE